MDCYTETVEVCARTLSALQFKIIAIVAILVASGLGVFAPLVGSQLGTFRSKEKVLLLAKSFAAGVILATGFVHILPDAEEAFDHPCVPEVPWKSFPFYSCIAMVTALATLVLEFVSMSYFEHNSAARVSEDFECNHEQVAPIDHKAAAKVEAEGAKVLPVPAGAPAAMKTTANQAAAVRKVVISQILELGIIAHSIIIGLTLGVSQNPCTIKPLMVALCFHQFFEGVALGSCVSEAQFRPLKTLMMAGVFAITAPVGVAVGTGISSGYNPNSAAGLIVEGIFDSASAGILIYLALVDLIGAEFLSVNTSRDRAADIQAFLALFGGAAAMAALAISA